MTNERINHVVLEGLDGAGKSSVVRELVKLVEPSGVPFHVERGLATDSALGRFARRHPSTLTFLVDQVYWHWERVRPLLDEGVLVLQDRNTMSVATYEPDCHAWYNRALVALARAVTREPDLLVFLHVPLGERMRRLEETADNVYHRMLLDDPGLIEARDRRYEEEFDAFQGRKVSYDTSLRSAEEVAREVFDLMRSANVDGMFHPGDHEASA